MNSGVDLAKPIIELNVIDAAKRGDAGAYEVLIRTFDSRLRTLAFRLLGDLWAEDVLQDCYVKVFQALPGFEIGEGSIGAWLHTIVFNACIDHLRRSQVTATVSLGNLPLIDAHDRDPGSFVLERELIRHALHNLSIEQRAAVVLIDELGLDYASASQILGIPRGTVASRLNAARRALRIALGEGLSHPANGKENSDD